MLVLNGQPQATAAFIPGAVFATRPREIVAAKPFHSRLKTDSVHLTGRFDLGFAFLEEPDGLTIEIVDVPGHERFVKNMLAGVGGIDLAMLVVAADEGVMPQTREHLAICSLLHIHTGLVVLTKTDLAEPDWLELVRDDVAALVRGTFLEGAPVLGVSARTGDGVAALRDALRASDPKTAGTVSHVFSIGLAPTAALSSVIVPAVVADRGSYALADSVIILNSFVFTTGIADVVRSREAV